MKIFNRVSDRLHYYLDNLKSFAPPQVKIEHFKLDLNINIFIVYYRLGRKKILHHMEISQFERTYFIRISNYDQHRLTKFSLFQIMLQNLFLLESCKKSTFINYVQENIKNDQLF